MMETSDRKRGGLTGAGVTGKRPLVQLPWESLVLDDANPRLLSWFGDGLESIKPSQFELLKVMYQRYDARSLAISMATNGYFDEEPLVVVPKEEAFAKTIDIHFDKREDAVELITSYYAGGGEFIVVEGNRRLTALKLLLDNDLRARLKLRDTFPTVTSLDIYDDLTVLPCVVYPNRTEVIPYLGVKHIRGPLRWEAFSQATYAASIIDESIKQNCDPDEALEQLERQTGNTGSRLKRLYIAYKIFKQLEQDIEMDVDAVIERFSFVAAIYANIPLRTFIGLKAPSATFLKDQLISQDYLANAELLFEWVFGNKEKKLQPVVMESRDLTGRLSVVVGSPDAVAYLRQHRDLSGAYDRRNGDHAMLLRQLDCALLDVRRTTQLAFKCQDAYELLMKAKSLEVAVRQLRVQLLSDRAGLAA